MSPRVAPWLLACGAAAAATIFALNARLPLPFEGFAALAAAALAFAGTLAAGLAFPARWLWSDEERLHHAFRARHGLSDTRAELALEAITRAHGRAARLRLASADFSDALRDAAERSADALDAAARDIFYDPVTLATHRATLLRSELVEEAVDAHARLRARSRGKAIEPQIEASRDKVATALTSLEEALDAAGSRAADRLLIEVGVSSATAETLLKPRRSRISPTRIREDHS